MLIARELKALVFPLVEDLTPAECFQRLAPVVAPPRLDPQACVQQIVTGADELYGPWIRACARYAVYANSGTLQEGASMLLVIEKVIILKTVSIFAGTPDSTLAEVAALLEEQVLSAGERLFEKGDPGRCMYIIVSGRLRVHDGDQTLNELGERDIVGEMAVLESAPRSASVTAVEETRLLRLDQEPLYELMADHVDVARGIIGVLSSRLRARIEDIGDLRARLHREEEQHALGLVRDVGG